MRYIICELNDRNFDPNVALPEIKDFRVRTASRGVLVHDGKVALLNVTKKGYHKLPGGGIEAGETYEEAFKREVVEETGCQCEIKDGNAVTVEYRGEQKLLQISYVFRAEVVGEPGQPVFDKGEIEEGFVLEWYPIAEVETVFGNDQQEAPEDKFIHMRDSEIFKFYKDNL
ncbi:MAG TPA: NUDIX domain-containing protein [Patescibacteria group bacterium]|nr:NUDIX domain-containing protein [Patescibacteria group bacterium]